jgi:hypothetical protein
MSTPLSVFKMPKSQLVIECIDSLLSCCPRGEPPSSDNLVFGIRIFLCLCILIILVKLFVQGRRDALLDKFVKRLCPMEEASAFLIFHWISGVTKSIDLLDNIPICLGAVYHKTLEVDTGSSILKYDNVQVMLEEDLYHNVFRLHI